jgi:hypothetical protein
MRMAGELDDRWLCEGAGLKPGTTCGREESPDTALRQQRKAFGFRAEGNPSVRFADLEGNGQRAW